MRKILAILVIFLALILVIVGWWNNQLGPVSSDTSTKEVIIAKGQSLSQIADQLQKEGLIKSSLIFQIYVRQKGMGAKLQAGLFKLSPSQSFDEIIKTLTSGPEGIWVRLIEGWRIEEMAEEINIKLQITNYKFLEVAKEGYMFPDSYLFPKEATAEYVVNSLRETFKQRFSDDLRSKIKKQGLTEEEGVILSSIVEREARSERARQMVASILLKRFKIGMGLNADATLQYALGYQAGENPPAGGWWKRHLTREDKKVDSPYNTYLYNGLPPTPISNPGLSSLKAVANADPKTPYLYYYHDSKGNSHYAKTLEEHNINIANNP
ncbi:endolytic transglycosylase MltG [Candidatus Microgenomates bacterium]|nr:endolytic transglycosylase MltG [Candidatus Microgenomates bacterium]